MLTMSVTTILAFTVAARRFLSGTYLWRRRARRQLWSLTAELVNDPQRERIEMAFNANYVDYIAPYIDWSSVGCDHVQPSSEFQEFYDNVLPELADMERLRQIYARSAAGFRLIGGQKDASVCQTFADDFARKIEMSHANPLWVSVLLQSLR